MDMVRKGKWIVCADISPEASGQGDEFTVAKICDITSVEKVLGFVLKEPDCARRFQPAQVPSSEVRKSQ